MCIYKKIFIVTIINSEMKTTPKFSHTVPTVTRGMASLSWGQQLHSVTLAMHKVSSDSRWGRERDSRESKKTKTSRIAGEEPIVHMIVHLNEWQNGNIQLFDPDYVFNYGYRTSEHQMKCFMLVLKTYACTQRVADRLMSPETRSFISYKVKQVLPDSKLFVTTEREFPESMMALSQIYLFRFPRMAPFKKIVKTTPSPSSAIDPSSAIASTSATLPSSVDIMTSIPEIDPAEDKDTGQDDKYMMMLVLPSKMPVSTVKFFQSLHDITSVGCVLPAHYSYMIKNCGAWRSMQRKPVDNFGQWKHIGLGKDASRNPFLLRCSVGQASSREAQPSADAHPASKVRRYHL